MNWALKEDINSEDKHSRKPHSAREIISHKDGSPGQGIMPNQMAAFRYLVLKVKGYYFHRVAKGIQGC